MRKNNKTKNVYPVGIFLILFIILTLLSAVLSSGYFYFVGKSRIAEIEEYTRNYSLTLAEAFAGIAELSFKDKEFSKLNKLFNEKIEKELIDEAFFVLADGTIIAHSDKKIMSDLKGNIATDEFAYNTDLILLPLKSKSINAQFMDYNIFGREAPFDKRIRIELKKYLYSKIDVVGWLVTRAVYVNGNGVGCISFIISKDRIYKFLIDHAEFSIKSAIIAVCVSFIVSFFISIVIFLRYRKLRKVYTDTSIRLVKSEGSIRTRQADGEVLDKDILNTRRTIKNAIKVSDRQR